MTIEQLNKKLNNIESKVRSLIVASIRRHQKEIVRRNQEQLLSGKDANDKKLGDYKDPGWIRKRKKKGRQTEYVDLNFAGDFQKSMFVKFDSVGMSIGLDATDKKKDILVHHWGEDILGLSDENFDWLMEQITDDLANGLKAYFA